jgi:ABC-type siderophore export system fused ATPase/permease subunit
VAVTDPGGLSEAILLRLADRLVVVEQQAATNAEAMRAMGESAAELRRLIASLTHDVDALRTLVSDTSQSFDKMRVPLQELLDLKTRLSGAWLVITALLMVVAYLLQPVLTDALHRHFGGG